MSDCRNPRCPIHGDSPEAKNIRDIKARVVSNEELMTVIRILAANTIGNQAEKARMDGPYLEMLQATIIAGERDSDPTVQGLVNGFVSILRDHRPTQEYFALCAAVPEDENYLTKVKARPLSDDEKAAFEARAFDMFFETMFGIRRPR